MKIQPLDPIVISDLRGGRNGCDPPLSLPFNQAVEAVNIDWKDATVAHKRGGSAAVAITGGTAFSSGLQALIRHVPGNTETAAELWAVDGASLVKRLAGGTSFANVALDDAISARPQDVLGVSLNGKLYLPYDSTVDRLHVYDPALSSPRVRRVGIDPGLNAPTVADHGSGSYAADPRYYRVIFEQQNGALIVRRSEPTPSVAFTPGGSAAEARVTRPAAPGEGETHWQVEVSADNVYFYRRGAVAIATTTFDDSEAVSNASYAFLHLPADPAGFYGLFPSVKFLITDGNRLLGAGAYEASGAISGGKNSRIWFTPVLGSSDEGDDERIPNQRTQRNWVDVNENDGGGVTGLGGPLAGVPWYFKYRQIGKLRPTGDAFTPYLPKEVRDDIGCVASKTIALGQDHLGRGALYFLSHHGPYRITVDGDIQYVGRDNEDIWRAMNLGATTVVGHSLYYPDLHHWEVWVATGASNDPDTCMVFDTQRGFPDENGQIRGGWIKHTGDKAGARCSCLFANTVGASMSKDLKPHIGRSTGTTLLKLDTADLDDNGTAYQAYVATRPMQTIKDLLKKAGLGEPILVAKAQPNTSVSVTINRNFGKETRVATVDLGTGNLGEVLTTETRLVKKVEGLEMGEADVIELTLGDASALANTWTIDALIVPVLSQEAR